jgi:hypothetical protein
LYLVLLGGQLPHIIDKCNFYEKFFRSKWSFVKSIPGVQGRDEVVAEVELLQLLLRRELVLAERVELVVGQVQRLQVLVDVEGPVQVPDLVLEWILATLVAAEKKFRYFF